MNNIPNVVDVAKAQKHRSTFPLSFSHKTTQDFGKTTILHACEVMPNDEFSIKLNVQAQLAPMLLPTMDNVNLFVRAFFVPFRFVWSDWEDFFSQKRVNKKGEVLAPTVPQLSEYELWQVFMNENPQWILPTSDNTRKPDYYVVNTSSGQSTKYRLTYHGRLARQILEGLGYTVNPVPDSSTAEYFSALPLMCLAKIFRDYYVNPNYEYITIDRILSRSFTNASDSSDSYKFLKTSEIRELLRFVMFGWFESDILTSAWKNPELAGYSNVYKSQSVSPTPFDLDLSDNVVRGANNDSVSQLQSGSELSDGLVSQIGLNVLKSVRNFVMRQSIAGGRFIDQLLSRFGIRLDVNEARMSRFLGEMDCSASIGRVDATNTGSATWDDGNTIRTAIGDYVGRGIMDSSGTFHFKNDKNDFGMLIFVSHLMPRTAYYQGVKPHVNHVEFNDFFNPDLEDVSNAPIPNNVVFNRYVSNIVRDADYNSGFNQGVFGFAPNYFEYKSQFDYLTGDFSCPSLNTQLKAYQLMRQMRSPSDSISQYYEDDEGVKPILGEDIQRANQDNVAPYTRMFLTQSQDSDHFIMSYNFDVRAVRDCNSLGNSLLAQLNEHGNDVGALIKLRPNGKFF